MLKSRCVRDMLRVNKYNYKHKTLRHSDSDVDSDTIYVWVMLTNNKYNNILTLHVYKW